MLLQNCFWGTSYNLFTNPKIDLVAPSTNSILGERFWVKYRYRNACGWSAWAELTGSARYCGGIIPDPTFIVYPNPASSILNIEFDQSALAQSQASLPATTDGKQLKQDPTFDIRLYDNQGNLLRHKKAKGGTVQFNVASLPNGIYYLHIYDGVNEKPEIRQIMVEH